ncbi:dihydropteroate synthase [Labedella endophytica]|uniref:dihydropteroate synthase n=1 Tax=Labedella endophytica TaxID=1523160 RepID=A0A433JXF5_9MICO|nr:dihydropteroate synthase [Labedella endophytica]RUR03668.1 dihydropteroate synthase [Labedella endophytica]
MGVLNVTPDSFSDGGLYAETGDAIAHGLALVAAGADIIDVGGESTRPGATRVALDEELRRILPVVETLASAGVVVSVDTMNASTARAAVDAGARIVNDVSGGLADAAMNRTVAALDATFVISHWRGHSIVMEDRARYDDVVEDVIGELGRQAAAAVAAGVARERIVVDPGLGFAKRGAHNWILLAHLDSLAGLGFPVMVGASRKRFLGELAGPTASIEDRDLPTAVLSALLVDDVWAVRVHDVTATRLALDARAALRAAR